MQCADLLKTLKSEELYLKTVEIKIVPSEKSKEFKVDLEKSFGRLILPGCRVLDINITRVPKMIKFFLSNAENVSFHIDIVEKNQVLTKRGQDSFAYNGPFPKMDKPESETLVIGLRLKQSYYSDQDKSANCINYPNTKFKSFKECDEYFITDEMKKFDVMPYWATNDQTKITRFKYDINVINSNVVFGLYRYLPMRYKQEMLKYAKGDITSPCVRPCLRTKVKRLEYKQKNNFAWNKCSLLNRFLVLQGVKVHGLKNIL